MFRSIFKCAKGLIIVSLITLLSTSCSSYKKVPYIQSDKDMTEVKLRSLYNSVAMRYQRGDIISITVNAIKEPLVAESFNLPIMPQTLGLESPGNLGRHTYLVDDEGEINFPILGKLKVAGLSTSELDAALKKELKKYFAEEPILTIRMTNFRVSVLGEVARPGMLDVTREKVNVLEALTLAGDMTIYGKRDDVVLLRELPEGKLTVIHLDLTSPEVVASPYFYMQQNDVLYVIPNKAKTESADIGSYTNLMIALGSLALSVAGFIVWLVNK